MHGSHHVEGRAQDGIVVAIEEHFRGGRVNGVEFGEHAKFTAHIVRRFHFTAEGRAAEDQFFGAEFQRVREIGVAGGELANFQHAGFFRKVMAQIGLERRCV